MGPVVWELACAAHRLSLFGQESSEHFFWRSAKRHYRG